MTTTEFEAQRAQADALRLHLLPPEHHAKRLGGFPLPRQPSVTLLP